MKRSRRMIFQVVGLVVLIIMGLIVWLSIPFSPMKTEFEHLAVQQNAEVYTPAGVFAEDDIAGLPLPVQRYFRYCGFIGTPKMVNMKIIHRDVDFILSSEMPKLKIQCTQFNSAMKPERIAFIDTSLYRVPFEGIDSYQGGFGSMKGVLAKNITLFNQTGEAMNKSSLVTCLAESLLMPNFALQPFMHWEAIDDGHARATISYYGISASGIFSFDANGLLTSFTTDDRLHVDTDGNVKHVKWSAICGDYSAVGGIKQPRILQAVWHLDSGDLVYFDGRATEIQYDVK